MLADLDRRAVEADRPDVMLAAAVRAAAHLHVDPAGRAGPSSISIDFEPILKRLVQAHRSRDPELPGFGARGMKRRRRSRRRRRRRGRALGAPRRRRTAARRGPSAQDQVLVDRRPGIAAAEVAHDLPEPAELLGAEIAAGDLHVDRGEARLALCLDLVGRERLELGAVAVRRARRAGGAGAADSSSRSGSIRSIENSRSSTQSPSSSRSTISRTASMPILSTRTLIRARARLTRSQSWRSKIRSTASVTRRYSPSSAPTKSSSLGGDPRHDRRAPADHDREPLDAVSDPRDEADVVDAADRPVGVRGREGGLHLARHQLRRRVADEVADVGDRVGGRVEGLVGGYAAQGSPVTLRIVLPQPSRLDTGRRDLADQSRCVGQRHVVHLDVLAGRDVALLQGTYFSTTLANASICSGVMPPSGSLTRIICTSG